MGVAQSSLNQVLGTTAGTVALVGHTTEQIKANKIATEKEKVGLMSQNVDNLEAMQKLKEEKKELDVGILGYEEQLAEAQKMPAKTGMQRLNKAMKESAAGANIEKLKGSLEINRKRQEAINFQQEYIKNRLSKIGGKK